MDEENERSGEEMNKRTLPSHLMFRALPSCSLAERKALQMPCDLKHSVDC